MTEKNLYQKLVEVRKSVKYIQKTADGYKFKYATEGQILDAIRDKMDEEKVFLELEMISLEPIVCHVIVDKRVQEVPGLKAVYEFIWTNADKPEEQIKRRMIVQDTESSIKTCGGLMTYANRYFLYKFFSVPTDKLDPDSFENSQQKTLASDSSEKELDPDSFENSQQKTLASDSSEKEIEEEPSLISDGQVEELNRLFKDVPDAKKYVLAQFKIYDFPALKSDQFDIVSKIGRVANQKKKASLAKGEENEKN